MILQSCFLCHRRFAPDRLVVHEQACRKSTKVRQSSSSHRYHYNSQKHRLKGLDHSHSTNLNRSSMTKKTHWKERHEHFQNLLKGQTTQMIHDNFLSSISDDRPYSCSHCQRKFATEISSIKHQKGCSGTSRSTKLKKK